MSAFDLTGKTAVVTGAAGILGKQFCQALLRAGANVVLADIQGLALKAVEKELSRDFGEAVLAVRCDVASPASAKALARAAVKKFGGIDILLNNAAIQPRDKKAFFARFEDYSLKTWREVMGVNLDGMFLVAQAVGEAMVRGGKGGSIIQTSSIYGLMAPDQRIYAGSSYKGRAINSPAVYAASKAGVIGLTRYLAAYWADEGIRVNALVPGGIESGQNETFKKKYSARVPMNRMAKPEEMVGAVLYLASDASRYMTGQNLVVDGGLSVW